MTEVPDEVRALAAERDERRRAKDFAAADALRDRIAQLGFAVIDGPGGLVVRAARRRRTPSHRTRTTSTACSTNRRPADVSVHWVVEGWPEDVARALAGFRANEGGSRRPVRRRRPHRDGPRDVRRRRRGPRARDRDGLGRRAERGAQRSRGRIVARDGRVGRADGRRVRPARRRALDDPSVGVGGPFGISTEDLREFHDSEAGPEVDAIEGYLMAFRRRRVRDVGLFDEKFRWYRTADIELLVPRQGRRPSGDRRRRPRDEARAPHVARHARGRTRPALQAQLLPVPRALPGPLRPARGAPTRRI